MLFNIHSWTQTMKHDEVARRIKTLYEIINEKPEDRLGFFSHALKIKDVIIGSITYLDGLKGSPYLDDYTEEDLKKIHQSFYDSAVVLLKMLEHFNEKTLEEKEENPFAV